MNPKEQHYEIMSDSIIKKFNQRGIDGYFCATKEEALATAKRFLTPDCSISWGGSESLKEIGLFDALNDSDYVLYDRSKANTEEERRELYGKIVTSDFFFMSSNAITLNGELVNIDGYGNRVACLITGPKHVVIVAGMNKIVSDVEAGISRVHNIAAPPNGIRLGLNTPCSELGHCANCFTKDCMCCQIVVTRKSKIPGRIKVILVGEELGY